MHKVLLSIAGGLGIFAGVAFFMVSMNLFMDSLHDFREQWYKALPFCVVMVAVCSAMFYADNFSTF